MYLCANIRVFGKSKPFRSYLLTHVHEHSIAPLHTPHVRLNRTCAWTGLSDLDSEEVRNHRRRFDAGTCEHDYGRLVGLDRTLFEE